MNTWSNARPQLLPDWKSLADTLKALEAIEPPPPIMDLVVCSYLPRTVKDRDGNEVELLGVLASREPPTGTVFDAALNLVPGRFVLLTGDVVTPSQTPPSAALPPDSAR